METLPVSVNFTALPSRFTRICRDLSMSLVIRMNRVGSETSILSFFWSANGCTTATAERTRSAARNSVGRTTSRPSSRLVNARISSIIAERCIVTERMRSRMSSCGSLTGPMT